MDSPPVKRALISVSDKLGLAEFARGLVAAGIEIFSTGGTRKHLESENIPVQDVTAYTGFPEILDGRVKTLHPKVHGGILARLDRADDQQALSQHGIHPFELIVVNLYPFEATIAREGVTRGEAIEQIDIGGPTMVRAAAKNHAFITIVTAPEQYATVLEQVTSQGCTTPALRSQLAAAAFAHTARYDTAIAGYLAMDEEEEPFPEHLRLSLKRQSQLRYGENPHQAAALYRLNDHRGVSLATARQLHGKELSYNNILDLDSALGLVRGQAQPAVVVIKHNNPCGAAADQLLAGALKKALAGDPLSAFGSVLGFNRPLDVACAEALCEPGLFIEAIVAPGFEQSAVEILTSRPRWKANVRLIEVGEFGSIAEEREFRGITGGLLAQIRDLQPDPEQPWRVATEAQPTDEQLADLRFAWNIVRHVKSNAIVLAHDQMLLGAGAGQMSRVDSVEIAIKKAGDRVAGSVLASDAFFPFPDSIHTAATAGVVALIQPGGSRRDDEVVAAANEHQLPMIFTGMRHFKH